LVASGTDEVPPIRQRRQRRRRISVNRTVAERFVSKMAQALLTDGRHLACSNGSRQCFESTTAIQ
jgi:hypothetical protein